MSVWCMPFGHELRNVTIVFAEYIKKRKNRFQVLVVDFV